MQLFLGRPLLRGKNVVGRHGALANITRESSSKIAFLQVEKELHSKKTRRR